MKSVLSAIASGISSGLLMSGFVQAQGTPHGNEGASSGSILPIIIDKYYGSASSIGGGNNAINFYGKSINISSENEMIINIIGLNGGNGLDVIGNSSGGAGSGGLGGGAVVGGISNGGAGGNSSSISVDGGNGGDINNSTITLKNVRLTGGKGGKGGKGGALASSYGGGGAGGDGGGSVFGGISTGGAGGKTTNLNASARGGSGGHVSNNVIQLNLLILDGEAAAAGGEGGYGLGGGGAGGHGGGSVFGGMSKGGSGGSGDSGNGGNSGNVSNNTITLRNATLNGADGGVGGRGHGGGSSGGHGGGSVFGGVTIGGASGSSLGETADGGIAGEASGNMITLTTVTLNGGVGGDGGIGGINWGGGGSGGFGGGSVVGGISNGGAGGYARGTATGNGGNAGSASKNTITLMDVNLNGKQGGDGALGGTSGVNGGTGVSGYAGGSVFGGVSIGGSGGYSSSDSASGGNGAESSFNRITISGVTNISGDIYGGISQGGAKGTSNFAYHGKGSATSNNIITLIGDKISISGSIYGGMSKNGDDSENLDADYQNFYAKNTINIIKSQLELKGEIKNFKYYNWLLPKYLLDGDVIIEVKSTGTPVNIQNTLHTVDVEATGNILNSGDQIILISRVTGVPDKIIREKTFVEQGFFIVYNAEMVVQDNGASGNSLVLNVLGRNDSSPIHPESQEFLKGRIAQLALVDQGIDMISDKISYARASLRKENANIFTIVEGGTNKYKNGEASTLNLNDFKFAVGAAKAIEFENKSVGMVAAFAEHGNANYSSYNYFDYFGDKRGSGKLRYSGAGLMFHMDVAGTDVSKVQNKPNIFDDKYGLYVDAALRVGHIKADFHSADMVNGAGVEASYNTKSRYASAMAGVGYVWTLDEKRAVDLYGHFTFSRLNGKDIQVVDEQMHADSAHSKRIRLGARYGYTYSDKVTPYAGVAFERNFTGDVTGSAYGFTIKETSLKGNTGIVEAGVMVKPKGAKDPFSMHLGVQGSFGQRKGGSAGVRARYVF